MKPKDRLYCAYIPTIPGAACVDELTDEDVDIINASWIKALKTATEKTIKYRWYEEQYKTNKIKRKDLPKWVVEYLEDSLKRYFDLYVSDYYSGPYRENIDYIVKDGDVTWISNS